MTDTLSSRVRALTAADRAVDAEIYAALNPHMTAVTPVKLHRGRFFDASKVSLLTARRYLVGGATDIAPRYTGSVDDAMTVIPAEYTPADATCLVEDALATLDCDPRRDFARFIVAAALQARGL